MLKEKEMKIRKEESVFKPIHIILETQTDLDCIRFLIGCLKSFTQLQKLVEKDGEGNADELWASYTELCDNFPW
jgi:hypothetical protein